ncbi:hypothetical protein Tco_0487401 [Tanacetum coccineum]
MSKTNPANLKTAFQTDTTNNNITNNVNPLVKSKDLPRLLDPKGGSHVINVSQFDVEDFSSWKDRFLVYLGLEPYLLEILENKPYVPKSPSSTPEFFWLNLKSSGHEGPSEIRDTNFAALRLKFNAFKALKGEKNKSENRLFTEPFDWDKESLSSEDEGTTTVKAFMDIAEDEPVVGETDVRSVMRYFSFRRYLDELHVTWAHLEKKRTRLRTNTRTLEDLYSQSLETASQAIHDAITPHQVTTSHYFMMASVRTDSNADLEDSSYDGVTTKTRCRRTHFKNLIKRVPYYGLDLWSLTQFFYDHVDDYTRMDLDFEADGNQRELSAEEAWEAIENFAQCQKEWDNPPNIISEQEVANLKAQAKRLFRNEDVWVQMHRGIAWDKKVEETLRTQVEVEPLDETKLEDLGLNTCNHDIPLSNRKVPSFDEPKPQPNPLPNYLSLDMIRGLNPKEVSPLGKELSLFDRPNEVERGKMLEAHRLELILQQQISQCMAPSHHDVSLDDSRRLYLMRRSLEVLRKFHWMILGGRFNQLSHVSSPLLSKQEEY